MLSRRLTVVTRSVVGRGIALVQAATPTAPYMAQSLQTSASLREVTSVRSFHTSKVVEAKAKKGGSKKGDDDDASGGAQLPNIADTKKSMENIVDRFSVELGKLKVGKASVDIFRDIQVGSYGSVSSAGQVTVKSASSVAIAVYDPTMVKTVADAIKDCGLGFAPTIENSVVSVFIPKPSKESRDALAKSAGQLGEKAKLDVRNSRKKTLDEVKKIKGSISEDESKRFSKEVETVTEKSLEKVTKLVSDKEKEIQNS